MLLKRNTKHTGDITEAFITARLLQLDTAVSKPVGDNQPYDLIIDRDGLKKVQCKTFALKGSSLAGRLVKNVLINKKNRKIHYIEGEVDIFMFYSPDTERCYQFNFNSTCIDTVVLSLLKPRASNIKYAKDYELGIYPELDINLYTRKCDLCDNRASLTSLYCRICSRKVIADYPRKTKIDWPLDEILLKELEIKPFTTLARELGVSDNAIRKHLGLL